MAEMSVEEIQRALAAKGFTPGALDGVWGRKTIAALTAFQKSVQLKPDGIFGPQTRDKLFANRNDVVASLMIPWLAEAQRLIHTKEFLGSRSNPVIMDWASNLGIRYSGDDVPWCGLFVAHCLGSTLPEESLPAGLLSARSWSRFGVSSANRWGAVMVFWRESESDLNKGHVGFYAGEDDNAYRILGGNQNNQVCIAWVNKKRLLSARWPTSAQAILTGAVQVAITEKRKELLASEV